MAGLGWATASPALMSYRLEHSGGLEGFRRRSTPKARVGLVRWEDSTCGRRGEGWQGGRETFKAAALESATRLTLLPSLPKTLDTTVGCKGKPPHTPPPPPPFTPIFFTQSQHTPAALCWTQWGTWTGTRACHPHPGTGPTASRCPLDRTWAHNRQSSTSGDHTSTLISTRPPRADKRQGTEARHRGVRVRALKAQPHVHQHRYPHITHTLTLHPHDTHTRHVTRDTHTGTNNEDTYTRHTHTTHHQGMHTGARTWRGCRGRRRRGGVGPLAWMWCCLQRRRWRPDPPLHPHPPSSRSSHTTGTDSSSWSNSGHAGWRHRGRLSRLSCSSVTVVCACVRVSMRQEG